MRIIMREEAHLEKKPVTQNLSKLTTKSVENTLELDKENQLLGMVNIKKILNASIKKMHIPNQTNIKWQKI